MSVQLPQMSLLGAGSYQALGQAFVGGAYVHNHGPVFACLNFLKLLLALVVEGEALKQEAKGLPVLLVLGLELLDLVELLSLGEVGPVLDDSGHLGPQCVIPCVLILEESKLLFLGDLLPLQLLDPFFQHLLLLVELVGQVQFLLLELLGMLAAVISCLVGEGPESLVEGVEVPLEARGVG